MRVVLDPNVLVSAVISAAGPPREIVMAWVEGHFDLVASPALIGELRDVLARPRLRRWVSEATATEFIDGLAQDALMIDDPPPLARLSPDPDDDYLIALARSAEADYLVSGDRHLLSLADQLPPVLTPRQFIDLIGA